MYFYSNNSHLPLSPDAVERSVIARAISDYHANTCIKFRPRTTETDYVTFTKGNGCSSLVGKAGGAQPVTLGQGCVYTGIVIHELMHAVGFWHEQSRFDRDDFVTVYPQNIQPGKESIDKIFMTMLRWWAYF